MKRKTTKPREWWAIRHEEECPRLNDGYTERELEGFRTRRAQRGFENYCAGTCEFVRVREFR